MQTIVEYLEFDLEKGKSMLTLLGCFSPLSDNSTWKLRLKMEGKRIHVSRHNLNYIVFCISILISIKMDHMQSPSSKNSARDHVNQISSTGFSFSQMLLNFKLCLKANSLSHFPFFLTNKRH